MRWIKRSPRSSSLDSSNVGFTKVHINSENKQKMLDIKMQNEAVKQKYRQAPEDSAIFLVNVSHLSPDVLTRHFVRLWLTALVAGVLRMAGESDTSR